MDSININNKTYSILRLLGKGKGGYSYLVTDGANQYVCKQIHHEPCDYYTFGDKLAAELGDYDRLSTLGLPLPRLLAVDREQERLLKEYIDGPTAADLVEQDALPTHIGFSVQGDIQGFICRDIPLYDGHSRAYSQ